MVKIRVVGEFGDIVAKALSSKMKIACVQIDDIVFDVKKKCNRTPAARNQLLRDALKKSSWIIEGSQAGMWTLETIHQADIIIVTEAKIMKRNARSMLDYAKRNTAQLKDKTLERVLKALNWRLKEVLVKDDRKRNIRRIIVFNDMQETA